MSKITNDGLIWYGTGCFIAVPIWKQWASKGGTGMQCVCGPVAPVGWWWSSVVCDVDVDREQRTRRRCRQYRAERSVSSARLRPRDAAVRRLGRSLPPTSPSTYGCRPPSCSSLLAKDSQNFVSIIRVIADQQETNTYCDA